MNAAALKSRLIKEEGSLSRAYDDATGKPVKQGDTVHGFLTIGVGRNLFANPLSQDEIDYLLDNDVAKVERDCTTQDWWRPLDEARQTAMADMTFNLGLGGVLQFKKMLTALNLKDWAGAAREIRTSAYYQQVPHRAEAIAQTLETGVL